MTWRPLPGEGEPTRPVRASLERIVASLGAPSLDALAVVFDRWAEVAGADLAPHATPVALRDGRLTVAVADPAWATTLRYRQPELLARIEALLGARAVVAVDVRVRSSEQAPEAPIRRG